MVEQGSCVLLLHTNPENIVVGVTTSSRPTDIIVTIQEQGVRVYEVFDQRVVKSFSQPSGTRWSVPAVEVPHDKGHVYFGVLDQKLLCSWTSEDTSVDARAKELGYSVSALFGNESLEGKAIVVSTEGVVSLCDVELRVEEEERGGETGTVQWAESVASESGVIYVLVLSKTKANHYSLSVYSISAKPQKKRKKSVIPEVESSKGQELSWRTVHSIRSPTKGQDITCCSFNLETLTFCVFWNDGTVSITEFSSMGALLGDEELSRVNQRTRSLQIATFLPIQSPKTTKPLCKVAAGPYCSLLALSGKSYQKQLPKHILTLWETHFGTLQGSLELEFEEIEDLEDAPILPDEDVLQVVTAKEREYMVVVLCNHVVRCYLPSRPNTLASSLNAMKQTSPFLSITEKPSLSCPSLETFIHQALDFESQEKNRTVPLISEGPSEAWLDALSKVDKTEEKELQNLLNGSKTATKFQHQLEKITKREGVSDNFVKCVSDHCLAAHFWDSINYLLQNHFISLETCPQLSQLSMENNNLDLIKSILENCKNISEDVLVDFLTYLLSCDRKNIQLFVNSINKEDEHSEEDALVEVINLVVSHRVNDFFLTSQLRRLNVDQIMYMLKYLNNWIRAYDIDTWHKPKLLAHSWWKRPSLSMILTWVCGCLDSHFTDLILTDDCHEIVHSLASSVKRDTILSEQVQEFKGYVHHFISRSKISKTKDKSKRLVKVKHTPDYSIEVLLL